ncbi:restriction endonuclease subunit S [Edwardsiella tarda]
MAGLNKYRAYSEYNSTNIEGLVQLPSHWELKQVRYLLKDGAEGTKIGPFGSSLKLEDMVDDGVQVYGQENVIKRDFSLGKRRISFNKFKEMGVYEVFFGDILITMMGTSGKCEIVPQTAEKGIIDSHLIRVRVNNKLIIPGFFKLLVDESPEIKHQIKIQGKGSIMLGLNSGIIRSLYLPLPSISEQKLILGFLDYETKKIDNLIEKQQKLIELLKEKRQAVISHAVTKGLNPDVPMKDSGVEWLGEVPAHWIVSGFKKYLSSIVDYRGKTPNKTDDGILLVTARNIKKGGLDYTLSQEFIAPSDYKEVMSRGLPDIGDVLFTTEAPLGEVANVDRVDIALAQRIIKFKGMTSCLNNYYFKYFIMSSAFQQSLNLYSSGSTAQGIKAERFVYLKKLLPPINEQIEIVDFLDKEISKIDILVEQQFVMLSLLQERRTALISAAVTGKIDVRDWVAPGTQESEEPQEVSA